MVFSIEGVATEPKSFKRLKEYLQNPNPSRDTDDYKLLSLSF
jgi:hypothetical protein